MPLVRKYTVHVFNNLYADIEFRCIEARDGAAVYAERNYFENCYYPINGETVFTAYNYYDAETIRKSGYTAKPDTTIPFSLTGYNYTASEPTTDLAEQIRAAAGPLNLSSLVTDPHS